MWTQLIEHAPAALSSDLSSVCTRFIRVDDPHWRAFSITIPRRGLERVTRQTQISQTSTRIAVSCFVVGEWSMTIRKVSLLLMFGHFAAAKCKASFAFVKELTRPECKVKDSLLTYLREMEV
jgi:hypothetical protein